jgi:hypothetical protein
MVRRARRENHPLVCPYLFAKYSASQPPQIISTTPAVPFPQEGRFAVVTDVGSGMRWTLRRQARDERADE